MTKDPVCGMTVDEQKAAAAPYQGKTYHFCSVGCKVTFEKAPAAYVADRG